MPMTTATSITTKTPTRATRAKSVCDSPSKKTEFFKRVQKKTLTTPHAIPMFHEYKPRSSRTAMEKAREDPLLSKQFNSKFPNT